MGHGAIICRGAGPRNRPRGQVCLTPGQLIGPPSPMVHAVVPADAPDMSDPRKVSGMRRGVGASLGAVVLATLVIGIAACGDDGDERPTAPEAANATPRADAHDLGRYLMRRDEEPGFRPGAAPGAMPRERANHHGRQGARERVAPVGGRRAATEQRRVHLAHVPADPRPPLGRGHGGVAVRDRGRRRAQPGARVAPGRDPRGRPGRRTSGSSASRAFPARAAGPRPCPASRRAAASGTSSGCRVGACTSSGTRAPVPSPARCRGARGRSMNARATSARARSRPGHRGARACERHSPCRSRSLVLSRGRG